MNRENNAHLLLISLCTIVPLPQKRHPQIQMLPTLSSEMERQLQRVLKTGLFLTCKKIQNLVSYYHNSKNQSSISIRGKDQGNNKSRLSQK